MNKPEVLSSLGKLIKEQRLTLEFTQEELGDRAGLDRTYISSVERGQRNVSLINLFKISNALEVSLSTIVEKLESSFE